MSARRPSAEHQHEFVYDVLSHPLDDEWQRRRSPFWELPEVGIPVFSIGVWGKASLHLRIDNGVMDRSPVRFFVNGEGAYHAAESWPPPDAEPSTFYLSGEHSGAVTSLNDGSLTETAPTRDEESTSWS